ncbi:MAG: helix-turn-helix domain-containing protein [Pseudomonadota bacterium]
MQAASELMVDGNLRKLTTNAVAERAGVSIGTLYQYFSNKEAIADALRTRHGSEVLRALETAAQARSAETVEAVLARMIRANIDEHLANPRLHRVLTIDYPKLTTASRNAVCQNAADHVALFSATETRFAELLPHLDRKHALRPMLAAVFGLVESTTHALVVDCPAQASADELESIIFASSQACMDRFVKHETMTRPI